MLDENSPFRYGGDHPAFPKTADDARLWRYMTLAQFLALLGTSRLHFSRLDSFNDPFEATIPKRHVEADRDMERSLGMPSGTLGDRNATIHMRKTYAASCWHEAPHESEAMWQLYAGDGVAITTTFGRLCTCFPAATSDPNPSPIYIGRVRYIDYSDGELTPIVHANGRPSVGNAFIQVMHKRLSFEHEREVRAVIHAITPGQFTQLGDRHVIDSGIPRGGVDVPVALGTLIEEIRLSPALPGWFGDVVKEAVSRYGLPLVPKASSLADAPYG